MGISGWHGEKLPKLPLDVDWDTGLAAYCEQRWPVGRRKAIEREWDLTPDDARSVVEGKASKRVITKIWKHPRGGWAVALPIMSAVIGHPVQAFFDQQLNNAAREQERALEHQRLARAAYGRLAGPSHRTRRDGDIPTAAGETRRSFGKVGPDAPRRLERSDAS